MQGRDPRSSPWPRTVQTRLPLHSLELCLLTITVSHLPVRALGSCRRFPAHRSCNPHVGFRGCHRPTRYVSIMVCLRFRGASCTKCPMWPSEERVRLGVACRLMPDGEPLTYTTLKQQTSPGQKKRAIHSRPCMRARALVTPYRTSNEGDPQD